MITGGEVELHVQGFSERTEEPGDEFGPTVGGNMLRNSVFGEHVSNEQNCKVFGGTMDRCWNEDTVPCLDRWSTITRIESQPEEIGSVSMKSIDMEFHRCSGIGSCFSKP